MEDQPAAKRFRVFDHLFGRKDKKVVSEEEILQIIHQGSIDDTSKEIIQGIFEFSDKVSSEIMTPRLEVSAIDVDKPIRDIIDFILDTKFSRLPVYEGDLHQIIGILNVKDFLGHIFKCSAEDIVLKDLLSEPYIVPETKNIRKLLKELQSSNNHMAILLDEYGDFTGLVTMEDILEEIVGYLLDENEQDDTIIRMEDNSYLVDGLVHIDELNRRLNFKIECEHFDTIGGFVVHLIGSIPKETVDINVNYKDLVFEVEKVKGNRVDKLRIYQMTT
ncbi:MAG: hypothetical protein ATN33_01415 [Epulopiscium sp. Nele67-Bin001]|nr:MAG: hypothetical protein BEN18_02580 [Epulopiscium sp. Nuni2H_MBin001]OON91348.1 MAG: hypothetical protein ATN33_01415 [Epulopiscium sp. Nele67-Bin001]